MSNRTLHSARWQYSHGLVGRSHELATSRDTKARPARCNHAVRMGSSQLPKCLAYGGTLEGSTLDSVQVMLKLHFNCLHLKTSRPQWCGSGDRGRFLVLYQLRLAIWCEQRRRLIWQNLDTTKKNRPKEERISKWEIVLREVYAYQVKLPYQLSRRCAEMGDVLESRRSRLRAFQ